MKSERGWIYSSRARGVRGDGARTDPELVEGEVGQRSPRYNAPIVKELPMEYAVEMNRLIQLQMEGSVG